jgi:hypothetical protein
MAAFLNTAMDLLFQLKWEVSWVAEWILVFEKKKEFCIMEFFSFSSAKLTLQYTQNYIP